MENLEETWALYASQAKIETFGYPAPWVTDDFYEAKFRNGEVLPHWNAHTWLLGITQGIVFSTRYCNTATKQGAR